MANVTNLYLDIEPTLQGGVWRRRMLHGSPAASAMALGGRKEWSRRQLQRPFEELMTRSASESMSLAQRYSGETSSSTLSHHLPQIPGQGRAPPLSMAHRSNSRLGSKTSLQNLNLADVLVGEGEEDLELDALGNLQGLDQSMSGGASTFGQSTGEMDFGVDKRASFQGGSARNQSPRSQWANTLEAALEEADVQLLFRLDLPLMVKAVADGDIHSLKEVTPPRWNQMKVMAMDFLEELERMGPCRPGQKASLKVVSELYDCLEEQGCNQGFDALCKSFTFLFGGLEEVQKVLDVNKNGLLSTTEFSMAMCLSGLDLAVICGLDEREIFLAVDVNHSGSISIEELLRFCSSKPAETKLTKDRAKKERERKAAAAKSKSKMNTTAIIEQAGLKVVQEKEVQGVRFQAMVVPRQSSSTLTPAATRAGVGMDVTLEELDEEEIDDMLEVLAKEEILRAQAKWICVSRWLASVLGASSLENDGQERAKTWEDERQQAYDAVEQAVLVPMAAALPAVFTSQDGAVSGKEEASEASGNPTALKAGEELDHQLEKLFQEEATLEDGGSKLLDRSATRHFFEDLMLADFKWHQKLRMVILDRLYDDTLNIQKEQSGLAKGLTFRSLKVVLHRMLRDHAEHWMECFRANIERQMNKRSKAAPGRPSRPGRA